MLFSEANCSTADCGTIKKPNVISISFGSGETEFPVRSQICLCWEFLKLGLQGVSVVIASGDSGVASRNPTTSLGVCAGPDQNLFEPSFLSSCPFITFVGATAIQPGKTPKDPESAALETRTNGMMTTVQFASGGGFSNRFATPWYQRDAVAAYLGASPPPFASYNRTAGDAVGTGRGVFSPAGRAFSDVAAVGDRILEARNGSFIFNAGTSALAPVFAGIISRINGERLKAGKSSLGFLNPTLYKHADALNDVTNGTNLGCGTPGFKAAESWDPVTGLGTPNCPKLLDVFMKLP